MNFIIELPHPFVEIDYLLIIIYNFTKRVLFILEKKP